MKDQQIGHYKILEKLGAGGMGEVWLAEDTRLERKVALKFLPHFTAQDESEKARFYQEAKVAARLKHQNIAQVYEINETEDRIFIVMEYVEGGSLRDHLEGLKGRPIPIEKVLEWIQQTAEGLAEAHNQGVIHRDIKPDNLMLTSADQLKITDFGLARFETSTRLTAAGATLGTVNYMSPEQIRGVEVDHRADLFSLGATCYELLTGRKAFETDDAAATYYSILNDETDPITRYRRDVSPDLENLVERLMQKDPALRCQSAIEVVGDIRRILAQPDPKTQPVGSRRTFRERLQSIPRSSFLVAGLIAATLLVSSFPQISNYRQMLRELTFGMLRTAVEGGTDLRGFSYDRAYPSVIPLPYSMIVLTKEKVLRGLDQLKNERNHDAYIAAALIKGGLEGEQELMGALDLAPTDPHTHALLAQFRYVNHGPTDGLAAEHVNTAMRLDSENGVYPLLAAVYRAATQDTLQAEELLYQAAVAPVFAGNLSRHYGAVYRCLNRLGMLRPSWQWMVLSDVEYDLYRPFTDLSKAFMNGWYYCRNHADWKQSWGGESGTIKTTVQEYYRRGEIIEAIANRMISDETNLFYGFAVGIIMRGVGLSEPRFNLIDESESAGLQGQWRQYRTDFGGVFVQLFRRDRALTFQTDPNLVLGILTYSLYLWSWYFLILSLGSYGILRWRVTRSRQLMQLNDSNSSPTFRGIAYWLIGAFLPILILPSALSRFGTVLSFLGLSIIIYMTLALIGSEIERQSQLDYANESPDNRTILRKNRKSLRILFYTYLGLIGYITLFEFLEHHDYPDIALLVRIYWPLTVPVALVMFTIWRLLRMGASSDSLSLCRKAIVTMASLVLAMALFLGIEAISIGSTLQASMETAEPSYLDESYMYIQP